MKKHTGKYPNIVSMDIGYSKTRIVYISGGHVGKTFAVDMPEHMISEGHISSPSAMGDFLKSTLKEHGIRCKNMAAILTDEITLIRNAVVPRLPREQMILNLPYEFRDYIEGELSEYLFDYQEVGEAEHGENSVEILAVAVKKQRVEEFIRIAFGMGMRLVKAVPTLCVYEELLQERFKALSEPERDRYDGILDVGHGSTRMYVYKNGHYQASHVMDIGISRAFEEISYRYHVDLHLAKMYLETNFEECRKGEGCIRVFEEISAEVQKAVNLYEFANHVSLEDFWICGNASLYPELAEILKRDHSVPMYAIDDETDGLVRFRLENGERLDEFAQAVGLAQSSEHIINLAKAGEEKKNHKPLWITIAVLVVAFVFLMKFAIYDKFAALGDARAEVAELQTEMNDMILELNRIGENGEEVYHYTCSDMTEEEMKRIKRSKVKEVLSLIEQRSLGMQSFRLTENSLELTVYTASLDDLRSMKEAMEQEPVVKSFIVHSSSKGETGETVNQVVSQISIELLKVSETEEGKEGQDEVTE